MTDKDFKEKKVLFLLGFVQFVKSMLMTDKDFKENKV